MGRVRVVLATLALLSAVACHNADAELNRRVVERLGREPTPTEQFTVTTHGRIVRIKGVVHSMGERERLERAAREVDGVAGVENMLVVDAPVELTGGYLHADPVDTLIRDQVRSQLDAHELDGIAVEVKGRVITLKGDVPPNVHDVAMRIAAEATRTSDRSRVDDQMTIVP